MMMMPAARSKSRLSGIFTIELAGSAIFSRAPLWPQDATTRSPTLRSVTPAPTLSITPATSAAGENGNGTMFEKGLLAKKCILVTGGGSGLGAAMGRRFVELGAELIICGRRLELLEVTAAKMRSDFGGKVTTVKCDIRDGAAVDAMMDALFREAPIDVLVNNAAATFIAQTEHLSFRASDAILSPTLHGTMYCTLGAGKRWIERKHRGVVLSILSTSTIT